MIPTTDGDDDASQEAAAPVFSGNPYAHWPLMTGRDVSAFLAFSDAWLYKLEKQGYVERLPNKMFDAPAVVRGYIRFLQSSDRRGAKTEGRRDLIAAQVEKLQIDNANQLDSLIPVDDAERTGFEILAVIREQMRMVAVGLPVDVASKVEKLQAGAINRCEKSLVLLFDDLRRGRPSAILAADAAFLEHSE